MISCGERNHDTNKGLTENPDSVDNIMPTDTANESSEKLFGGENPDSTNLISNDTVHLNK
jgi:hypothetical protein